MALTLRRAGGAGLLLFVVLCTRSAAAEADPRGEQAQGEAAARAPKWFVPTLGAVFGGFRETLRLDLDGNKYEEQRRDLFMALAIGLVHPLGAALTPRLRFEGFTSLGLGGSFHAGQGRLLLHEDATLRWAPTHVLSVNVGLGAGFALNTAVAARSQAELRVAFSLSLFGVVDLAYVPYVSIPLGRSREAVFAGTRELSASAGFIPINFALRGRFRSLSW